MTSTLVYTSRTGQPNHAEAVQRIHEAWFRRVPQTCQNTWPEEHEQGEFPMSCWVCYADTEYI